MHFATIMTATTDASVMLCIKDISYRADLRALINLQGGGVDQTGNW
jgi:hypothetical protein